MIKQRLSKVLASFGVASRRACEILIAEGRVQVNGHTVLLPQTGVDPDVDAITLDGAPCQASESKVYYILNKPKGYICANGESVSLHNKRSSRDKYVTDLFPEGFHRLFTVGRLDKDTQGLLLVTNDGHFANQIIHPSANITKEYLVKTDREITHEHLVAISQGTLVEGVKVKPTKVVKVRRGTLKITIAEGKKREVRHLITAAGLEVLELTRIRLGSLLLGNLPIGSYRSLSEGERKALQL